MSNTHSEGSRDRPRDRHQDRAIAASSVELPLQAGPEGRKSWLHRRKSELSEISSFDLAALITAIYYVAHPPTAWYLQVGLVSLGIAAIIWPPLRRSKVLWIGMTFFSAWRMIVGYWSVDNHTFLLAYWCLALAVALFASDPDRSLAKNARLLIGFAFLFAVLWKAAWSPEFRDGSFLHKTFLKDERFKSVAVSLGGLTPAQYKENRDNVVAIRKGTKDSATLHDSARLLTVARVASYWTLFIESLVALLFLIPPSWQASKLRDAALLVFIWATYGVATVLGFGWLLAAMGMAQCDRKNWARSAYIVSFFAVLFFDKVPWQNWIA